MWIQKNKPNAKKNKKEVKSKTHLISWRNNRWICRNFYWKIKENFLAVIWAKTFEFKKKPNRKKKEKSAKMKKSRNDSVETIDKSAEISIEK